VIGFIETVSLRMLNFTKYPVAEVAKEWNVKVHYAGIWCGPGKRWLTTHVAADVTCKRCRKKLNLPTGR